MYPDDEDEDNLKRQGNTPCYHLVKLKVAKEFDPNMRRQGKATDVLQISQ